MEELVNLVKLHLVDLFMNNIFVDAEPCYFLSESMVLIVCGKLTKFDGVPWISAVWLWVLTKWMRHFIVLLLLCGIVVFLFSVVSTSVVVLTSGCWLEQWPFSFHWLHVMSSCVLLSCPIALFGWKSPSLVVVQVVLLSSTPSFLILFLVLSIALGLSSHSAFQMCDLDLLGSCHLPLHNCHLPILHSIDKLCLGQMLMDNCCQWGSCRHCLAGLVCWSSCSLGCQCLCLMISCVLQCLALCLSCWVHQIRIPWCPC